MTRYSHELIFISQIKRSGTGVYLLNDIVNKEMLENDLIRNEIYTLTQLSITLKTYIAVGLNSYVVKLK